MTEKDFVVRASPYKLAFIISISLFIIIIWVSASESGRPYQRSIFYHVYGNSLPYIFFGAMIFSIAIHLRIFLKRDRYLVLTEGKVYILGRYFCKVSEIEHLKFNKKGLNTKTITIFSSSGKKVISNWYASGNLEGIKKDFEIIAGLR